MIPPFVQNLCIYSRLQPLTSFLAPVPIDAKGERHHRDASRLQKGIGVPADISSETVNTSLANKSALADVNVRQNGMLFHRLFEFRHFLYAAKNPVERSADFAVGWHPEKGARRQKSEDEIHPWIQQVTLFSLCPP